MADDSKDILIQHDTSFFLRYFNIFILKTPFSEFVNYSYGLNKIFDELPKTKLSLVTEFHKDVQKEKNKVMTKNFASLSVSTLILLKLKSMSWLNKIFLSGIFFTGSNYIFNLQMKEKVLNLILFSKTHYGQEARILTKYYIPNHKSIYGIQKQIEEFRNDITQKKNQINKHKTLVEQILKEENELDTIFIEEIARELEENDKKDENKKI